MVNDHARYGGDEQHSRPRQRDNNNRHLCHDRFAGTPNPATGSGQALVDGAGAITRIAPGHHSLRYVLLPFHPPPLQPAGIIRIRADTSHGRPRDRSPLDYRAGAALQDQIRVSPTCRFELTVSIFVARLMPADSDIESGNDGSAAPGYMFRQPRLPQRPSLNARNE